MKTFSRIVLAVSAAAIVTLSMSSCVFRIDGIKSIKPLMPEGDLVTKTVIPQDGFNSVGMAGSFDMEVIQSQDGPKIEVTTYENLQSSFHADVKGNDLSLYFKSDSTSNIILKDTKVVVYVKDLKGVSLAGSGDLKVMPFSTENDFELSVAGSGDATIGSISCADLTISVAGSGDINASGIACKSLKASIAGSGDIVLSGTADFASYSVAGSGDIDAKSLKAGEVKTSKAGSGDIRY